jgi:hypothetical protein
MTADVRKGMPDTRLSMEEFRKRFLARFYDPAFAPMADDLERIMGIAWEAYQAGRKAPITVAAGD